MGNGVIAFLASVGASAWIYNKLNRSTGGNLKSALTATVISGVAIFILLFLALNLIIPASK